MARRRRIIERKLRSVGRTLEDMVRNPELVNYRIELSKVKAQYFKIYLEELERASVPTNQKYRTARINAGRRFFIEILFRGRCPICNQVVENRQDWILNIGEKICCRSCDSSERITADSREIFDRIFWLVKRRAQKSMESL